MDFMRRFLPYKDGIPSHNALNDLINVVNPKLFFECFIAWVSGLCDGDPDIVAIDGKASRRTIPGPWDASRCNGLRMGRTPVARSWEEETDLK